MSPSDQDEPRGSRRRRGRGKEDSFDDFWTRDNGGTPGRGRKRGGDARVGGHGSGDISDLAGEAPAPRDVPRPDLPRRGRSGAPAGPARTPA
ncbi:MAG: hypothetical protein ACRD0R_10885, partial [Acidimicrobiales bacterium]